MFSKMRSFVEKMEALHMMMKLSNKTDDYCLKTDFSINFDNSEIVIYLNLQSGSPADIQIQIIYYLVDNISVFSQKLLDLSKKYNVSYSNIGKSKSVVSMKFVLNDLEEAGSLLSRLIEEVVDDEL